MRRIELGDVSIAADEAGSSAGRSLVLLHGYTGCRGDWTDSLGELAKLGHTLAPDLRGHGDSTNTGDPASYTTEQLSLDLLGLLDALQVDRCDLLGHSFGARVALRFALQHPQRVASLVLMNAATNAYPVERLAGFEKAWEIARAKGMDFLQVRVEAAFRGRLDPSPEDQVIERWADVYWKHHRVRYAGMDPEAYAALGRELAIEEPALEKLDGVRCPTLVMVGEHDTDQLDAADRLARGIAGAEHVVLAGAGHHPQRETPEAWQEAIRQHLCAARGGDPL